MIFRKVHKISKEPVDKIEIPTLKPTVNKSDAKTPLPASLIAESSPGLR
jgi:hypothetical protein